MLETIDSIISLIGKANTVHDIYKKVCTLVKGDKIEQSLQSVSKQLGNVNSRVERLSDHILYAPNLQSIKNINQSRQQVVNDLRDVRASLEPVQKVLKEDILSSAMIWTPEKMKRAITKNPWEVLMNIRPVNLCIRPTDPDMLPILFEHNNMRYVGWQLRGTLPMLFDCEYHQLGVQSYSMPIKSNPISKPNTRSLDPFSKLAQQEKARREDPFLKLLQQPAKPRRQQTKIITQCKLCKSKFKLTDDKVGIKIRCPKCKEIFIVEILGK